jgi:hypothetical protein
MCACAGPPEVKKHKEDFSHLSEDSRTKIDQTDKALDRIDECLDHLKLMAFVPAPSFHLRHMSKSHHKRHTSTKQQDMGEELDDHNRRLEILNRDVGDRTQKTTTLVHDIKRRL